MPINIIIGEQVMIIIFVTILVTYLRYKLMKKNLILAVNNSNSKTSPVAAICYHRIEISMPRFNFLQSLKNEGADSEPT